MLTIKLISGETFKIDSVDLNKNTQIQLIEKLITLGVLQPDYTLPHVGFFIVDKNGERIRNYPERALTELGIVDGDNLRIILDAVYGPRTITSRLSWMGQLRSLQDLERVSSGVINIFYKKKWCSNAYNSIMEESFINDCWPGLQISFKVKYTFPKMYVGRDQIIRNWSHAFTFDVSYKNAKVDVDFFEIDGGAFPDGYTPFNSHVIKTWINIGERWDFCRDLGIWYFLISIGALLNQEKSWMNVHETIHLNQDAFDYWVNDLNMQPNNIIKWPLGIDRRHIDFWPREERPRKFIFGPRNKKYD